MDHHIHHSELDDLSTMSKPVFESGPLQSQNPNAPIPSKRPTAVASSKPEFSESNSTRDSHNVTPDPSQMWSQPIARPRPPVQRHTLPLGHLGMLLQAQVAQINVLQHHTEQVGVVDPENFDNLQLRFQSNLEESNNLIQHMLQSQGVGSQNQQQHHHQQQQQQQQQPRATPTVSSRPQQPSQTSRAFQPAPQQQQQPQVQQQQHVQQQQQQQENQQSAAHQLYQQQMRHAREHQPQIDDQSYMRAKHATANKSSRFGGDRSSTEGVILIVVEFKRQRTRRYEGNQFVTPGQYVICDGDRGIDCGLVVHCSIRMPDGTISRSEMFDGIHIDLAKVKNDCGRVHRLADENEVNTLHGDIASMERYALKTCRDRVNQMGLSMEVVDCEFQFDRKKVTFFFDSNDAIDFRELTKDLFKIFGTRIWLENINAKVKNVVPEGALSHADKQLYAERGLKPTRR